MKLLIVFKSFQFRKVVLLGCDDVSEESVLIATAVLKGLLRCYF